MRHCRSFRAKTKQFRVCCICWVIASFELMYWDPSYALIPPEKNMENENLPHLHKKHKQKSSYATSRCRVAHSIVVDFAQPLSKWYCWLGCACMRTTHQYDEWHKNMSSPKSMYWTSGRGFFNSLDCFSCFFSDILHCNGKVSQVLSVGCRACWPTRCRLRTQRASPFMYAIHFSKCNFSFAILWHPFALGVFHRLSKCFSHLIELSWNASLCGTYSMDSVDDTYYNSPNFHPYSIRFERLNLQGLLKAYASECHIASRKASWSQRKFSTCLEVQRMLVLRNIQWHREEEKSDNDFITASWKLHFFHTDDGNTSHASMTVQ